ncbi:hypothetical protein OG369_43415 [Streptomyces sp. NBC_01221]|nr:hypothetical protein [Streptomyces sp. NBC_01221]MCX4792628.1 hypothetical protein [Streptomyces sp. NBC_01221]
MRPAAASAGFHSWMLKLLRQTTQSEVFVKSRPAEQQLDGAQ